MERGSGLLVHISELPSKYGIGNFGSEAKKFVRFLKGANQKYWQILPLNPTSFGDSPYQSFSAFALNPYFIDLHQLVKKEYLTKEDLKHVRFGNKSTAIDYGKLYQQRYIILKKAFLIAYDKEKDKIEKFYKRNKKWLEDYALFMTIKSKFNGESFQNWPLDYRKHKKQILTKTKEENKEEYLFQIWMQYEAFNEYFKLKKYANKHGIKIIGDMPIYVSLDSSDVWSNHKMFLLNASRRPTKVAGVPPDYFSTTGQLWGNPLYDYEYMKKNKFLWWRRRFRQMSKLYDVVRVDHFRGFDSYWVVDSKETTAMNGYWAKGPGYELFEDCKKELSKIEIIAEDLGIINDDVRELKKKCGFPGLKLYQFAFENYKYSSNEKKYEELVNPYLPHNYEENCVAYIGTHDNEIESNFIEEHPELHNAMLDYLKIDNVADINDTLIGSLMRSKANVVIFLPQDILHLGKESRINTPGVAFGNWNFRFKKGTFTKELELHLKQMVNEANR